MRTILFEIPVTDAQLSVYSTREINQQVSGLCRVSVSIGNNMISSDIWHKYHE